MIFFLAERTRCRTIQIHMNCAKTTCTVILDYMSWAHVLSRQENTGIYKQNDIESSNPRQVRSLKNTPLVSTLKGPVLTPASKEQGKPLSVSHSVDQSFRAQFPTWEQTHSRMTGITVLMHLQWRTGKCSGSANSHRPFRAWQMF